MKEKTQAQATVNGTPALVVFGLDDTKRPHASAFVARQAELAEKAAGLMGMATLRPATDEQKALAAKLPRGRVFASGRAFVPFVRARGCMSHRRRRCSGAASNRAIGLYGFGWPADGRLRLGPLPRPGLTKPLATPQPTGWADIEVGSVVLATTGPDEGWYESEVIEILDDLMKLRWCSWPDDPIVARRFSQVGLLPPTASF